MIPSDEELLNMSKKDLVKLAKENLEWLNEEIEDLERYSSFNFREDVMYAPLYEYRDFWQRTLEAIDNEE